MANARQLQGLFLIMSLLIAAVMVQACAPLQAPAPARPLKTIDLLVDETVMPVGWTMTERREIAKNAHHLSVGDSAVAAFEVKDLQLPIRTLQYIHRYRNSAAAKGMYSEFIRPDGNAPSNWNYQSSIADESVFACYDYEGREPYPKCEWSARYEEYIVTVYSWLIPGHMSLPDLEKVIKEIDSRMAAQLGKP
jgi:hypothetical protein